MRHPRARPGGRPAAWPRYLLALILCGLLGLAQLPASWPAAAINAACAGQCRIAEADGSWWQGRGRLYARLPDAASWFDLGPLAWQLDLFAASAEIQLGEGRATLALAGDGLHLSADGIVVPATLLLAQPALKLPGSGWQGRLDLRRSTTHWSFAGIPESRGKLVWRGAASGLLEDYPLGDLEMKWAYRIEDGLQAELAGGKPGNIELDGQLALHGKNAGRGWQGRLSGEARLANDAELRLGRYLQLIARPLGAGRYRLDRSAT